MGERREFTRIFAQFVSFADFALKILDFATTMDTGLRNMQNYNAHGHKLRFPTFEKAQFVTAMGIFQESLRTLCAPWLMGICSLQIRLFWL
jgi:hypothetical protein